MKINSRNLCWSTGTLAAILAFCSVEIHPYGPIKSSEQHTVANQLIVSRQIQSLLKQSCMDCHSNQTVWRWYSYVAPASWLVERDVRRGRDFMNFSEWDQYTFKQREGLLADIASAVKNHEMPLPQYTLIHHDAKLSDADADALYNWARHERRRLRSLPATASVRQNGGD